MSKKWRTLIEGVGETVFDLGRSCLNTSNEDTIEFTLCLTFAVGGSWAEPFPVAITASNSNPQKISAQNLHQFRKVLSKRSRFEKVPLCGGNSKSAAKSGASGPHVVGHRIGQLHRVSDD